MQLTPNHVKYFQKHGEGPAGQVCPVSLILFTDKGNKMGYIHQEENWPGFTWDTMLLLDPLVRTTHKHGILLGQISGLAPGLRAKAELESLTREILATASIEGWDLKQEAVRSALAQKLGIDIGETVKPDPLSSGYAALLVDAVKNTEEPLSAERLFAWNFYLNPPENGGMRFKINEAWNSAVTGVKQVLSGHSRQETICYEPPGPERLPGNLKTFIDWYNLPYLAPEAKTSVPPKHAIHPFIEAGIVYLWLTAIRPFERNNGLFAQALTDSLLSRYASYHGHFYSFSAQIQKDKKQYYSILGKSLWSGLDITPWLLLFIETMEKAIHDALNVFSDILTKVLAWESASLFPLNQRQKQILHLMLDTSRKSITTNTYAKSAKCSLDTALRDIRDMAGFGLLLKSPDRGRKTTYMLTLPDKDTGKSEDGD